MNVFLPYPSILTSAKALDTRRLHKQTVECNQMLKALASKGAWSNHPATLMFKNHQDVLLAYIMIADAELAFRRNTTEIPDEIVKLDIEVEFVLSAWLPSAFFDQHKKRLYTKDNVHYKQFSSFGEADINYYYVDNTILKYKNGKRLK